MSSMAAMEQATLGQFFSTRKKGLEGVHPAKRRKVDATEIETEVAVRRSTRAKRQVASSQTKTPRARKGAKSRGKESLNEENSESSCKIGIRVVSEPTSLFDDHAFAEALIGKLSDAQRKRKMASSVQTEDTIVNVSRDITSIKNAQVQGNNSEIDSKPKNRRPTARFSKQPEKAANSDEKPALANDAPVDASQSKAKSLSDQTPHEADVQVVNKTEAQVSPSKTPPVVRRIGGGVKANPWIAEQAKMVLSRGRAAVNLSQQVKRKNKDGEQVIATKESSSCEYQMASFISIIMLLLVLKNKKNN